MRKNCPICNQEYKEGESFCKTCQWDLSLYAQSSSGTFVDRGKNLVGAVFNEKVPKSIENWAITRWERRNYYQQKIKDYQEQLEQKDLEIKKWRHDIVFELKEKVEKLEEQQSQPSSEIESRIYNLEKKLSNLDEIVTDKVQTSLKNLTIDQRLRYLEQALSKIWQTNKSISKSEQNTSSVDQIDPEQQSLIDHYLQNPRSLSEYSNKVTLTKQTQEDIYLNKAVDIIFKISNQNEYWIAQVQSGAYYLVPDSDLRINTNLKLIRMIFDLQDYEGNEQKKFILVKCAKVNLVSKNEWKLTEKGILQF